MALRSHPVESYSPGQVRGSQIILRQQYARLYFAGEAANARDPVLALVPEARRSTLMATPQSGTDPVVHHFDIHLQGDLETVFFDV